MAVIIIMINNCNNANNNISNKLKTIDNDYNNCKCNNKSISKQQK